MNTEELASILNALGYRNDFSIGKHLDGPLLLICEDKVWKILFREKGQEEVIGVFASEHEACTAFLRQMKSSPPGLDPDSFFDKDGNPLI